MLQDFIIQKVGLIIITNLYRFIDILITLQIGLKLLDIKINNKRELQNIVINDYADIDYKDLVKIYRECRKKQYCFLTIDTTIPASDPLRFRKDFFHSYKNDHS